jgi:hypothetical protein
MPFANTWDVVQTGLAPGTAIPNWTAANGLLGDDFTVRDVTAGHVQVDTPGAKNDQIIPRADFEMVYDVWGPYCGGQVPRHEIRDMTRFSKYVISILHWLEGQHGGHLP